MWNVYGECENYHVINAAHAGAILQLTFNEDGNHFYTASTDKTVGVFDTHTGQRVKRLKGHTLYVNSCHPARRGPPLVVSGIFSFQNNNKRSKTGVLFRLRLKIISEAWVIIYQNCHKIGYKN